MEEFAECIFQWFCSSGHHWGAVVPPDQRMAFHPQLKVDTAHINGRDDDHCWWTDFDININLIGFVLPQIVFLLLLISFQTPPIELSDPLHLIIFSRVSFFLIS